MFERNMLKYSRMIYATLSSFLRKKSLLSASKKKIFYRKNCATFSIANHFKNWKKVHAYKKGSHNVLCAMMMKIHFH